MDSLTATMDGSGFSLGATTSTYNERCGEMSNHKVVVELDLLVVPKGSFPFRLPTAPVPIRTRLVPPSA